MSYASMAMAGTQERCEHARASGNSQGSPGSSLPLASMVADGGYTTPADTRQQQEEQARHQQNQAHTAGKDEW